MIDKEQQAETRGRDKAFLDLLDVVDDCDRAMELIYAAEDREKVAEGVAKMRERVLRRFHSAGISSYGEPGDEFNPHLHEAITTEEGFGPDNSIIRVHRRGWRREDGTILRAAMVTVCKGTPQGAPVRTAPSEDSSYICPYGTPGCVGNCPSCQLAFGGER